MARRGARRPEVWMQPEGRAGRASPLAQKASRAPALATALNFRGARHGAPWSISSCGRTRQRAREHARRSHLATIIDRAATARRARRRAARRAAPRRSLSECGVGAPRRRYERRPLAAVLDGLRGNAALAGGRAPDKCGTRGRRDPLAAKAGRGPHRDGRHARRRVPLAAVAHTHTRAATLQYFRAEARDDLETRAPQRWKAAVRCCSPTSPRRSCAAPVGMSAQAVGQARGSARSRPWAARLRVETARATFARGLPPHASPIPSPASL